MIVDDSPAYRKILSTVIGKDPEIHVIDTSENGKVCLEKLQSLKPDVITLDIEMPEMNGIETLQHIRQNHPSLPVIMLSTLTDTGAGETVHCLSLGASDFIHKVLDASSLEKNIHYIRTCVIPKIKAQYQHRQFYENIAADSLKHPASQHVNDIISLPPDINFLFIGVGSGGYQSLIQLLPKLEKNPNIPAFILCHMDSMYLKNLVNEIKKSCKLPIKIVEDAFPVFPRFIYFASADKFTEIVSQGSKSILEVKDPEHATLDLESGEPINHFLKSLRNIPGAKIMAVLLKFSGGDGIQEMQTLRANGHFTVIQDSEMLGVGESEFANIRVPIHQMHKLLNQLNKV